MLIDRLYSMRWRRRSTRAHLLRPRSTICSREFPGSRFVTQKAVRKASPRRVRTTAARASAADDRPASMTSIISFTSTSCGRCSRCSRTSSTGECFGLLGAVRVADRDHRLSSGSRRSYTFSNERVRQIERENRILLNKILAQKPRSASVQRHSPAPSQVFPSERL